MPLSKPSIKNQAVLDRAVTRARERNIILPTFAQLRNPASIPAGIRDELSTIGLWELHPRNLFRITWKNEPRESGGGFGPVNSVIIPPSLSGVPAPIIMLLGTWFPTGAHKVGAAYGCLAPRIIQGEFDPTTQKAVWPSTGNFCRGGAFDSYLMGCTAVAILPAEMSRERFEWLESIGAEVIATPGCESNVKEIYDKCWEIKRTRPDCVIFNQFEEWGNATWHYHLTGPAVIDAFEALPYERKQLAAFVSSTGSAGTIAAGDYLKKLHPNLKVVAAEALQCPTLLMNGFGGHRIEGIGDKHVPWIHNLRNTDFVAAIDDEACMRLLRLFNEPVGRHYLLEQGVPQETVDALPLIGISGIGNLLATIKTARYLELGERDVLVTVATDSTKLYSSRLVELKAERGPYSELQAARDFEGCLAQLGIGHLKELTYPDRKAIHNLKYFTWIEQQQRELADLNQLWNDPDVFEDIFSQVGAWDGLIEEFNERVGLIQRYR